jgi:hypothetical protein
LGDIGTLLIASAKEFLQAVSATECGDFVNPLLHQRRAAPNWHVNVGDGKKSRASSGYFCPRGPI